MIFLTAIWSKLSKWIIALGAILAAIGSVWLYGRSKGVDAQKSKDETKDAQEAVQEAQQTAQAVESRHETDTEVQKLPDAPTVPVATADPATAAGKLRDDGWTRD